jgi:hypothetical protein
VIVVADAAIAGAWASIQFNHFSSFLRRPVRAGSDQARRRCADDKGEDAWMKSSLNQAVSAPVHGALGAGVSGLEYAGGEEADFLAKSNTA